jgi:hypothetical protein
MKIRKQVYDLVPSDLDRFPVWEFALDEEGKENQDEATVRPRESIDPVNPDDGMFVVKASFTLANGKRFTGYVTPPVQGDDSIGTTQPIIVTEKGQVGFWCGVMKPTEEIIRNHYGILGVTKPADVFPLKYETVFPISSGTIKGQLTGFLYFVDAKKGSFSKKGRIVKEVQ